MKNTTRKEIINNKNATCCLPKRIVRFRTKSEIEKPKSPKAPVMITKVLAKANGSKIEVKIANEPITPKIEIQNVIFRFIMS